MEEKEKEKKQSNSMRNGEQHVAPVAAPWPPPWLAALSSTECRSTPGAEGNRSDTALSCQPRGWRLLSGIVLCAQCHPRPDDAEAVLLIEQGGLQWVKVDDAVPTDAETTQSTPLADAVQQSSPALPPKDSPPPTDQRKVPQWL